MKWIKLLLALAVVAGIGFFGWRLVFPDEIRIIRGQLEELAGVCRISPRSAALERAGKAGKIRDFFDPEISINLHLPEGGVERIRGDEALAAVQAALVSQAIRQFKLELFDLEVAHERGQPSAQCHLTAIAHLNGEEYWLAQEWDVSLRKSGSRWRILSLDTLKEL